MVTGTNKLKLEGNGQLLAGTSGRSVPFRVTAKVDR
jgi:hypothetical protein